MVKYLNKTKMDWTMRTWNGITGCLSNCKFCYGKRYVKHYPKSFPNGFMPTFHPKRLKAPIREKTPYTIFSGSMGDVFGPWIDRAWQEQVFDTMRDADWHQYQIITRFPDQIWRNQQFPSNVWFGTSVNRCAEVNRIKSLLDPLIQHDGIRFINFEPLFEDVASAVESLDGIDFIMIGAQTNPLVLPERKWVDNLIDLADEASRNNGGTKVFIKDSLESMFELDRDTRQYPAKPKVDPYFRKQIWTKLGVS